MEPFAGRVGIFSKLNGMLSGGAFAIFIALVIAALSFAGITSIIAVRVAFAVAGLVASVAIISFIDSRLAEKSRRFKLTGGAFVLLCVGTLCFVGDKITEAFRPIDPNSGVLVPGVAPYQVPVACRDKSTQHLLTFLASNSAFLIDRFPYHVVMMHSRPILWLQKNTDGSIGLNAEIFDSAGIVIAKIVNNEIHTNKNNIFYVTRTSHSITMFDRHDDQVFSVDYINER